MNIGVNISLYLVLFFVGKRLLVKNGNSSSGYIKNVIRNEIHGWKASNTILFFSAITFCACTLMVIVGALPPKTLYPRYRIFTMIALAPFFEEFYFRYVYFRCVKIASIDFLWLNAIFFGIQHFDRFVNPFSIVVTIVLSFFIISSMYYVTESFLLSRTPSGTSRENPASSPHCPLRREVRGVPWPRGRGWRCHPIFSRREGG